MTSQDLQMALIELQAKRTKRMRAMQEKREELVKLMKEAEQIWIFEWDHYLRWTRDSRDEAAVQEFINDSSRLRDETRDALFAWDARNGEILRALEKETSK